MQQTLQVNFQGGSLIVLFQNGPSIDEPFGFFPAPLQYISLNDPTTNIGYTDATSTSDMAVISPGTTSEALRHFYFHGIFTYVWPCTMHHAPRADPCPAALLYYALLDVHDGEATAQLEVCCQHPPCALLSSTAY